MAAAKRRRVTRREETAKRRRLAKQAKEEEERKLEKEQREQKFKEEEEERRLKEEHGEQKLKEEENEKSDKENEIENKVEDEQQTTKSEETDGDEKDGIENNNDQGKNEEDHELNTDNKENNSAAKLEEAEETPEKEVISDDQPPDHKDEKSQKDDEEDAEESHRDKIKNDNDADTNNNGSDFSIAKTETDEKQKEGCEENAGVKRSSNVKIFDKVEYDDLGLPMVGELINEEGDEEPVDEEEKKRIVTYTFDGEKYSYKEKPSVIEEREGKIEFRVVNNDGKRDSLIILTGLKNIFQKQLPEMPKAYITRLVFDRSHVSIAVIRKPLTVVGGITIKPFENHHFAEIVFCAISSSEQVRGYGAHMMNHLKTFVRGMMDVQYFLTYADNYAIGYFKKQGFTKEITLPKRVWMGYIKDYEGGTLMQCSMLPKIRYLDAPKILSLQRAAILRKIRSVGHSHIIRPGLTQFKKDNPEPINPLDIPGIKHAGWTKETDELAKQPKRSPVYPVMLTLLTEMQNSPSNWPFLQPVNRKEVPDYYEVIAEPMDLSTMEVKLENNAYETLDDFIYDCRLIFNNCRQYNGESTTFYKNANKLEKVLINKLKDYPEYSQYCDLLQQDK